MKNKDYYKVLGLKKDADKEAIKKAYRELAMKYHPDKNKDPKASDKFKEVTEAYNILHDDNSKFEYDHAGTGRSQYSPGNPFDQHFSSSFWDFIHGATRQQGARWTVKQRKIVPLSVTLEEIAIGCQKNVLYKTKTQCGFCRGAGGAKKLCSTCRGTGHASFQDASSYVFSYSRCIDCSGVGHVVSNTCSNCHGDGTILDNQQLSVTIQPGADHGQQVIIHQSDQVDLIGQINILPNARFGRQNRADLLCVKTIDLVTAVLGGEIELEDIYGKKIKTVVRAGIQNEETIMISGHGLPVEPSSTYKGNLYVSIDIEIPSKISKQVREIFESLRGKI